MKTAIYALLLLFGIASAQPAPPPPGLGDSQLKGWNYYSKNPVVKGISVMAFDRATLSAGTLYFTVDGKTYHIDGKSSREEGVAMRNAAGARGFTPARTAWVGQSQDGFGNISVLDDGEVNGSVSLRGRTFLISGRDNQVLFVEVDPNKFYAPDASRPAPAASGAQK